MRKPMRVSSSTATASNASSLAGLGHAPVDLRLRAHLADPVAEADHAVEPDVGELVQVFRASPGDVDPARPHHAHGAGVQWLGSAAGARRLDRPAGQVLAQRFGHLRAGAVAGAQEQDPCGDRACRRVRSRGPDAARRPRSPALRDSARGRARSSCRGRRRCSAGPSRAHRRGAGAGGRRPGSGVPRRARTTRRRGDRSAPARSAAANAVDARRAAETAAACSSRSGQYINCV